MRRDRENLAGSVEEYLDETPKPERNALERVRSLVYGMVPDVSELIADRIIVLAHHGDLIGLASQPRHLSLYTIDRRRRPRRRDRHCPDRMDCRRETGDAFLHEAGNRLITAV